MLQDLVQHGYATRDQLPFRLKDMSTGQPVQLHRSSVYWNDFRQSWVMIGVQSFGTSFLGEVWFSEAPTPEGPWENAVKIATHDRGTSADYSFYNPTSHPFFDQQNGRFIYFEGTYADTFSGNSNPTPLYDYNQIMYRLDLSTIPDLFPRLAGDYNRDGIVDGADYIIWRRAMQTGNLAADGSRNGVIDHADYDVWRMHFGATATGITFSAIPETSSWVLLIIPIALAMRGRHRT
jgi:hypothetical protein